MISIKSMFKKIAAAFLSVVILVPSSTYLYRVYADNKQDLENAKDKKDELESEYKKTQQYIDNLKKQNTDLQQTITSLDTQMVALDASLLELNTQIDELKDQIEETEDELLLAQEDEANQYASMKLRIQFMYEHNDATYLDMLMSSSSMADLLNKVEYINEISQYDRDMLTKLSETVSYIETIKAQLESDYEVLTEKQLDLEDQKSALELLQQAKQSELATLNANQKEQESYLAKIAQAKKSLDDEIAQIEAKIRQEQQAGGTTTSYDGGAFKWPTTSTRITSPFGDTDGRGSGHKGIDIGALSPGVWGDPIYAAYDGQVVISQWNNPSAGNYIMIYHGNGLYTRYLHCSQLLVSSGQYVTKGQKIALMGSTGDSTGAHLHFDVRLNGVYVNPMGYFK